MPSPWGAPPSPWESGRRRAGHRPLTRGRAPSLRDEPIAGAGPRPTPANSRTPSRLTTDSVGAMMAANRKAPGREPRSHSARGTVYHPARGRVSMHDRRQWWLRLVAPLLLLTALLAPSGASGMPSGEPRARAATGPSSEGAAAGVRDPGATRSEPPSLGR